MLYQFCSCFNPPFPVTFFSMPLSLVSAVSLSFNFASLFVRRTLMNRWRARQAWLIAERAAARRSGGRGHDAGRIRHAHEQVKSPSGQGAAGAVRFCGSNCFVLGCPLCSTSSRTLGHGNLATVGRCPGCCTCCSLCSRVASSHHAHHPSSSSSSWHPLLSHAVHFVLVCGAHVQATRLKKASLRLLLGLSIVRTA